MRSTSKGKKHFAVFRTQRHYVKRKEPLTLEPRGLNCAGPLKRGHLSIDTLETFLEICDNLKNSQKNDIA